MFYAKKSFKLGSNPDGAGFGSTTLLNINLKMLRHSEKNKVYVLHPTNFSGRKRLFFSRLDGKPKPGALTGAVAALLYLPGVLLLLGWPEISWEVAA